MNTHSTIIIPNYSPTSVRTVAAAHTPHTKHQNLTSISPASSHLTACSYTNALSDRIHTLMMVSHQNISLSTLKLIRQLLFIKNKLLELSAS